MEPPCLARKKLIVFLTFSLVLNLLKVNGFFGKVHNKKLSNLPTVRKKSLSRDFEGFRDGPPIGSYIYIMGHLDPDELKEHGFSINRRSQKPSTVHKKRQPVSNLRSRPELTPGSQQEAFDSTHSREMRHTNDRRLEKTRDVIRKWMKHRIKHMNLGAGKEAEWLEKKADQVKDFSIKESSSDLNSHSPKMNFMKWLHIPHLEQSFPGKSGLEEEWETQIIDKEIDPVANGEVRFDPGNDFSSTYLGEMNDRMKAFDDMTPRELIETYRDAIISKYFGDRSEKRNY